MMSSMISPSGGASADSSPPRTMLEECEEALAQSMLVFLLADLRLMSATGRCMTKYETIAIASDPPTRCTAADLAGIDTDNPGVVHNQMDGLTPAQMMAVVILELTKTVEKRREREQTESMELSNNRSDPTGNQDAAWEIDKVTGRMKIRAGNDDMHSLLKAYADLIGRDLKTTPVSVVKRYSMINLDSKDLDVVKEDDDMGEEESVDEEDNVAANDTNLRVVAQAATEAVGKAAAGAKDAINQANVRRQSVMVRANARRQSLMKGQDEKDDEQFGDLADALYRQGNGNRNFRSSLAMSLGKQQQNFTRDELNAFVQKAVDSRIHGQLDFLADFFKKGSVSRFMAESKARVVWMNDWYPLKDLTYCIAVNEDMKRVLVVFRGAITAEDWTRAVQSRNFCDVANPIDEDYEGKTDTINMAVGFYLYLFRVRKDTGTKKYDEIANLAYKYGKERIGEEFQLIVNGHSLGGALSTVFSFFASTDDRFTKLGPVKCFNFGSPMVGGNLFLRAFHHQEQRKLLMYARFFNHNDIVAHLPPNMRVTKNGGMFRHVGVGIRIPSVPTGLSQLRKWKPRIFYIEEEGFCRSYCRALRNNFVVKFPFPPWRFAEMHTLTELQDRLAYGQHIGAGDDFELLQKPIEEVYDIMVGTNYTCPRVEVQ